jgi:hypothetical protein
MLERSGHQFSGLALMTNGFLPIKISGEAECRANWIDLLARTDRSALRYAVVAIRQRRINHEKIVYGFWI